MWICEELHWLSVEGMHKGNESFVASSCSFGAWCIGKFVAMTLQSCVCFLFIVVSYWIFLVFMHTVSLSVGLL